jgi:hypothetical protein
VNHDKRIAAFTHERSLVMRATAIKRTTTRQIGIIAITVAIAISGGHSGHAAQAGHARLAVSQANTTLAQNREIVLATIGRQGDGLVDAANRGTVQSKLQAYVGFGQGEGLIDQSLRVDFDIIQRSLIKAHLGYGQGEGFVGPGASDVSKLLLRSVVKAYPGTSQGEGLIDASNRPAPKPPIALSSIQQGKGLIGPGGN